MHRVQVTATVQITHPLHTDITFEKPYTGSWQQDQELNGTFQKRRFYEIPQVTGYFSTFQSLRQTGRKGTI